MLWTIAYCCWIRRTKFWKYNGSVLWEVKSSCFIKYLLLLLNVDLNCIKFYSHLLTVLLFLDSFLHSSSTVWLFVLEFITHYPWKTRKVGKQVKPPFSCSNSVNRSDRCVEPGRDSRTADPADITAAVILSKMCQHGHKYPQRGNREKHYRNVRDGAETWYHCLCTYYYLFFSSKISCSEHIWVTGFCVK